MYMRVELAVRLAHYQSAGWHLSLAVGKQVSMCPRLTLDPPLPYGVVGLEETHSLYSVLDSSDIERALVGTV